jgi:Mn2+/Fe2+ NRAMP family transporter
MFSTTLTCLDAFPRVLNRSFRLAFDKQWNETRAYVFWALMVAVGSLLLLVFFMKNMKTMVDVATTIAFVTAPIVALLNYLVITHKSIHRVFQPPVWLKVYAILGLMFLTAFSLGYLWIRFV